MGRNLLLYVFSFVLMCLLWVLVRFLYRVLWRPIHIKKLMNSQGINGPSYQFLYGSTKEQMKMMTDSMTKPMENLSHQIFPKIMPELHRWIKLYGKNLVTWTGPTADIIVSEPDLAKEILFNKNKAYPKIEVDGYFKRLLGDSIATSEGERWAKKRKLANHAFHIESLKNMVPAMVSSTKRMLENWNEQQGKEIEVFEEFRLLTSEIISRTAFGSNYEQGKDIFELLAEMCNIFARNVYKTRLPFVSKVWKCKDDIESERLEKKIQESVTRIIKEREIQISSKSREDGGDLLGLLIKVNKTNDEKNRISDQDLIDECKTFYLAGHETTVTSLGWTIFLLAINQDWQNKAREEVLNLFGKELPNAEGLTRLKTMNMIINESLRLYAPVTKVIRNVKKQVRLGKMIIPAKSHVSVPILAIHHDPEIWGEDVYEFKPERFAEGVAKATENNLAVFMPFSLGPRICLGSNFAVNELRIVLSMILQKFTFTLSPTYIHSPVQALTIRPQLSFKHLNRNGY